MPRQRTIKSIFIDIVVFVGMFALLGHLSINFWERFVIQNELSNMKTSLHSLKETINRIGYAYDNLHRELLGLAEIAEKKQSPETAIESELATPQSKKKQCINKVHKKIPVEIVKKTKNHTTLTAPMLFDKTIQYITPDMKKNKTTQNVVEKKRKVISCSGKNMSTITRYPPKSTGVGLETYQCKTMCPNEEYCKYKKSSSGVHQNCKDFECYNPVYNWKF